MIRTKCYIAGKISGEDPDKVREKFLEAETKLRAVGFEVVNPIRLNNGTAGPWKESMKRCLPALLNCQYILLLEDFNRSEGAKIEFMLAQAARIHILFDRDIEWFGRHPEMLKHE